MIPVLAFVQHYKKFYTSQFESAAVRHGLNQLEIDILLFLHNNPDCRTASDICRYRGLAKSNVSKAVEHLRTMGLLTVSPAAGGCWALPTLPRRWYRNFTPSSRPPPPP